MNTKINDLSKCNLSYVTGKFYLEHTQSPTFQDDKCAYWSVFYEHKRYNIKINFATQEVTGEEWIINTESKETSRQQIPRCLAEKIMKEKYLRY